MSRLRVSWSTRALVPFVTHFQSTLVSAAVVQPLHHVTFCYTAIDRHATRSALETACERPKCQRYSSPLPSGFQELCLAFDPWSAPSFVSRGCSCEEEVRLYLGGCEGAEASIISYQTPNHACDPTNPPKRWLAGLVGKCFYHAVITRLGGEGEGEGWAPTGEIPMANFVSKCKLEWLEIWTHDLWILMVIVKSRQE